MQSTNMKSQISLLLLLLIISTPALCQQPTGGKDSVSKRRVSVWHSRAQYQRLQVRFLFHEYRYGSIGDKRCEYFMRLHSSILAKGTRNAWWEGSYCGQLQCISGRKFCQNDSCKIQRCKPSEESIANQRVRAKLSFCAGRFCSKI